MAPRYLLDTNTCIYLSQRRPENVVQHFARLKPGEASISVVTYGELSYGVEKRPPSLESLERLEELATLLPVLPLTLETAKAYGSIRADLERTGRLIGGNDLWIAAHARAEGLTLVTNNLKEFRRVRGLKLENWIT
ncbi:MAG TPA: type II toxin-antitoxin system VapC family toxin [Candidatus Acidoferrum sp.]|jgi:tRNA(fMet)-specific endonuclease VapC